jgi:hypothetical protein
LAAIKTCSADRFSFSWFCHLLLGETMGIGDLPSPDVASLYPLLWLWFYFALRQRRMSTYLSTGNPTDYGPKSPSLADQRQPRSSLSRPALMGAHGFLAPRSWAFMASSPLKRQALYRR